jgi:hypothetical protein
MTLDEAMKEIESHEFAARVNVASDLTTFLQAAQAEPSVNCLLEELDSPEMRPAVLSKVYELTQRQVDPRYENPWDTALAVYVWAMSLRDLDLAKVAAKEVVQVPQCWWAAKLSRQLLLTQESPVPSASSSTTRPTVQITDAPPLRTFSSAAKGTDDLSHAQSLRLFWPVRTSHIEWGQVKAKAEAWHGEVMEWSSEPAGGEAA